MASPNSTMVNIQRNSTLPKRPNTTQSTPFDDKPLWNHVTVLGLPTSGGNRQWSCNYCNKVVTGSYTKVKAHLLKLPNQGVEGCKSISDKIKEEISKEYEKAENQKARQSYEAKRKLDYVSLPSGSDLIEQKRKKGTVASCFNVAERDEVDKEIARMIFASAMPFSFVKNPYFRQVTLLLANSRLAGYMPPTYNRLRTTLLAQEKAHVNTLLQPFRDSWKKKGVSFCSDGWTDRQRRPLINVMAASGGGSMFLKSFDASGNTKDAEYVAGIFMEVIDEEGADNVVQIITDNAANFKAAGLIIESKYPHIFWTPCVVHSLNLALKAICEPASNSNHFDELGGKFLVSLLSEKQVMIYQEMERQDICKILDEYLHICTKTGVQVEKLYIEMESVQSGLVELISQHKIEKLVMGAAADKSYSRKMTEPKSKKASYVRQHAPAFCHVWFTCKGHLVYTRESIKLSCLNDKDINLRPNAEQRLSQFTSKLSTSSSRMEFEESFGQSSTFSLSQLSIFYRSSEVTSDLTFYHSGTEDREPSFRSFVLSPKPEGKQQLLTSPNMLEGKIDDTLYYELDQAIAEAEIATREAIEESMRCRKAEKDAIEAIYKANAAESLYNEELRRREKLEEELAMVKEDLEHTKKERDMALDELNSMSQWIRYRC